MMNEGGGLREDLGQRTDGGGRKTEGGRRRTEAPDWKLPG
jgi:hypothetical protein